MSEEDRIVTFDYFNPGETLSEKDMTRASELWMELLKAEDDVPDDHKELMRESSVCIAALVDEIRRSRSVRPKPLTT